MKLSRFMRVLVGLGTALYVIAPLLIAFLVVLFAFGLPLLVAVSANANGPNPEPPPGFLALPFIFFGAIFPLQCLLIPLTFLMISFYLIHALKNTTAAEAYRIVLCLGFVFMPFLAMPVYYFLYIWPETPAAWALAQPAPAS